MEKIESKQIQQIIAVLNAVKSRYLSDFLVHFGKTKEESVTASNILEHLQALIEPCNQLSIGEVFDCKNLFQKILAAIRNIWENCVYYQDDNHLSGLLKKVSDLVIHFITSKIDIENVFSLSGDVSKALDVLTTSVTVGASWNNTYDQAMKSIQTTNPNAWQFDHTELFASIYFSLQE